MSSLPTNGRRLRLRAVAAAAAVLVAAAVVPVGFRDAATANNTLIGTSPGTAARSCAEIQRVNPAGATGRYWVYAPAMDAPLEVHCDAGWTLVGRGREGWSLRTVGQGDVADVAANPSGLAAFTPAAYPGTLIDRLTGGGAPEMRIRRVTNNTGTSWQEMRWRGLKVPGWRWSFDRGYEIADLVQNGQSRGRNQSRDTGIAQPFAGTLNGVNDARRVITRRADELQGNKGFGWAGTAPAGGTRTWDWIWSPGTGMSLPFTQVYVMADPDGSFVAPPVDGMPAEPEPQVPTLWPRDLPWWVEGIDHTDEESSWRWDTMTLDIEHSRGVIYVGGRFSTVRSASGERVAQPWLAAFDAQSGAFLPGFRPQLDGRVHSIAIGADGGVLIGGDFTTVNGVTRRALAKLDPVTGELDPEFTGHVYRWSASRRARVMGVATFGNDVWVTGDFNEIESAGVRRIKRQALARFRLDTGAPVAEFHTTGLGTQPRGLSLDLTDDGTRLYAAGEYARNLGDPWAEPANTQHSLGLDAATGAIIPDAIKVRPGRRQNAILAHRDMVYTAGSYHALQSYDAATGELVESAEGPGLPGGQYQFIEGFEDVLFTGAHADNTDVMVGTRDWADPKLTPNIAPGWVWDTFRIKFITAFDPRTQEPIDWVPNLGTRTGDGPWGATVDDHRCIWIAGDVAISRIDRGFVRFCVKDAQVPTTPGNVAVATRAEGGTTVTWSAARDAESAVTYWIYRNDRVVGITGATSFEDTTAPAGEHLYWVRAVDVAGNRSATLAAVSGIAAGMPVASVDIRITAPADGVTFDAPGEVTLTAEVAAANTTVTRVEFLANGAVVATDDTAPYGVAWQAPAGTHQLLARAVTTQAGATFNSEPVTITVTGACTGDFEVVGESCTRIARGVVQTGSNGGIAESGVNRAGGLLDPTGVGAASTRVDAVRGLRNNLSRIAVGAGGNVHVGVEGAPGVGGEYVSMGITAKDVAVAPRGDGHFILGRVTAAGTVATSGWADVAGRWGSWVNRGGTDVVAVDAARRASGRIVFYALQSDGTVIVIRRDGEEALGNVTWATEPITAFRMPAGFTDIAVVEEPDGTLTVALLEGATGRIVVRSTSVGWLPAVTVGTVPGARGISISIIDNRPVVAVAGGARTFTISRNNGVWGAPVATDRAAADVAITHGLPD